MTTISIDKIYEQGLRYTKHGFPYDPSEDHWRFSDGTGGAHFDFERMRSWLTSGLVGMVKLCVSSQLEIYAYDTVRSKFDAFSAFVRFVFDGDTLISDFSGSDFVNFVDQYTQKSNLGRARSFLKDMYEFGLGGIEDNAYQIIALVYIENPVQNLAQKTLDPVKGPYTVDEFDSLRSSLHTAFEQGDMNDEAYLLALLVNVFGFRPKQIAQLKVCDFIIHSVDDNKIEYTLDVPRIKQKKGPRTEFTRRRLGTEIGEFLEIWIDGIKADYAAQEFEEEYDLDLLPIFPRWEPPKDNTIHKIRSSTFKYHISSSLIAQKVSKDIARITELKSLRLPHHRLCFLYLHHQGTVARHVPRCFRKPLRYRSVGTQNHGHYRVPCGRPQDRTQGDQWWSHRDISRPLPPQELPRGHQATA